MIYLVDRAFYEIAQNAYAFFSVKWIASLSALRLKILIPQSKTV